MATLERNRIIIYMLWLPLLLLLLLLLLMTMFMDERVSQCAYIEYIVGNNIEHELPLALSNSSSDI